MQNGCFVLGLKLDDVYRKYISGWKNRVKFVLHPTEPRPINVIFSVNGFTYLIFGPNYDVKFVSHSLGPHFCVDNNSQTTGPF